MFRVGVTIDTPPSVALQAYPSEQSAVVSRNGSTTGLVH